MALKHYEVHSFDSEGVERRLCALTGDNAEVHAAGQMEQDGARDRLLSTARRIADSWQYHYGSARDVRVVEVPDPRVWTSETPYRQPRRGAVPGFRVATTAGQALRDAGRAQQARNKVSGLAMRAGRRVMVNT